MIAYPNAVVNNFFCYLGVYKHKYIGYKYIIKLKEVIPMLQDSSQNNFCRWVLWLQF